MLGKYRVSMFLPKDIKGVIPMIKYYLLITDEEPEFEKYNPLQKIAYGGTFVMAIVMAVTGFALYWPVAFVPVVKLFGGLGYVRLVHYLFNWFFIVFLMIHIYLVFAEDIRKSFIPMITGYAPKHGHKT
jgi:Ni/Fe-hydrogenase 1 B-type cytochrome subunit